MCGWAGNKNQLSLWQDYPAKAVNWAVHVEGLDLEKGRYFMGGRTVLGGDCTVDAKLDWERIRWVVEAARSI